MQSDRALYAAGAPIQLEVLSGLAPTPDLVHVDVVKEGQTLRTLTATMRGGRGSLLLPPDQATFGTLTLRAYTVDSVGKVKGEIVTVISTDGAGTTHYTPILISSL